MEQNETQLLPPIPLDDLHWTELSERLDERTLRRILRFCANKEFESLRHEVYVMATTIRTEFAIDVTDVELSCLFGHKGGWAQGMISRYLVHAQSENPAPKGRPRSAQSETEAILVELCLKRQAERNPLTVEDVIEFMGAKGRQVDRFWVNRFVERHNQKLALQQAILMEKARHDVSADDLKLYFTHLSEHMQKVPSPFVWNADETRIGAPKKQRAPEVIVAKETRPGTTTVPEERDDTQLTLLTAISAFGDSIPPLIISKNQTYEKSLLAQRNLYEPHDYVIRNAPKTFMTEVLFIDWLETMFVPRMVYLRRKFDYQGPVLLVLDGHSTHVTPRVTAYAGSRQIIVLLLVPHSSHLTQPLDLCVFGLFKILYKKERKVAEMKGETLKIYRALCAFYKATIIPMVRWSFSRAGFRLDPHNLFAPLTVNPAEVLDRLKVPDISLESFVSLGQEEDLSSTISSDHRRIRIPRPSEFAISLKAYADTVTGTCPLCGHAGRDESAREEEIAKE